MNNKLSSLDMAILETEALSRSQKIENENKSLKEELEQLGEAFSMIGQISIAALKRIESIKERL